MIRTAATEALDSRLAVYEVLPYRVDEADLGAEHIMRELGGDRDRVFKTLVLKGNKTGPFVCVIPGDAGLDFKKAAKASGNRKCSMIPPEALEELTGYVRGGCSPLGMPAALPVLFHQTAATLPDIIVNAGIRGHVLRLSPQDALRCANATLADLTASG